MTTPGFPLFARRVADSFQRLVSAGPVFTTGVTGDDLYAEYLASFPPGTDPIFNTRTEHDCGCCRGFIRRAGNVVSVSGEGRVVTVWDDAAANAPAPYNTVAAALRAKVLAHPIADLFRVATKETSFGAASSLSQDKTTKKVLTWNHFYTGEIPARLRSAEPGKVCGDYRTTVEVFERGLQELTPDSVKTVQELIEGNNLYRGADFRSSVVAFQKAQQAYLALPLEQCRTYAWAHAGDPAARFRNSVIGTLVVDLSAGVDLETAVRSFEAKVAPTNYQRTTALITPRMVQAAMKTIAELGLEPALERRLCRVEDLSVANVRWVSGAARPLMQGGLAAELMAHANKARGPSHLEDGAEEITLDDFMSRVLPGATGLELLLQNENLGHLMALTAPVHPEPRQLFKWTNDFAWSYVGQVADSIAERVKKAGGRVDGALLRASLSWTNFDDLDLHVHEPPGRGTEGLRGHIHFRNKKGWTGGCLDVDMNAGHGTTRSPVENVVWTDKVPDGSYRVEVHNYSQRETSNPGFVVEVECGGKLTHFTFNKTVRQGQLVPVCTLHMKGGLIERIEAGDPGVSSTAVKREKWGLVTGQFVEVTAVTLSPNYWGDNATGNLHTFFLLKGCECDEEVRGFYNEFLHSRLLEHRKVFEVIGDKTKCPVSPGGLAGLGFSSTQKATFVARVRKERGQRTYTVKVG